METRSLTEIKRELNLLHPGALAEICLRLAKYKKENKELLGYLLFDSNYEPAYIEKVKAEIDLLFAGMNREKLHFAKKNARKILRITNKYIRFSGIRRSEAELRIYFCLKLRQSGIQLKSGTVMGNLFDGQVEKISKAVATLHEDLQHDYALEIARILDLS